MQNEERINVLEKRVHKMKQTISTLWVVLIVGSIILITNLNGVHSSVRANRFIVVNQDGKEVVHLTETTVGNGVVITLNGKGQTLVTLTATTDGEGMVITENGKGQTLVRLGANTDGEGRVTTKNGKGETTSSLP